MSELAETFLDNKKLVLVHMKQNPSIVTIFNAIIKPIRYCLFSSLEPGGKKDSGLNV